MLRPSRGSGQGGPRGAALALLFALAIGALASCGGPARYKQPAEEAEAPDGVRAAKPVIFSPEDDLTPSVSRDGRYLAYASEQNGNLDVWVRDWATSSTYPITLDSAEDFDPAVSPDGEHVAFVSRRDDAKGDVYVTSIQTAGGDLDRLTDQSTYDRQPIYAPDGKRIYFTAAVGIGQEFINAYELEERRARRVSPTPGFDPAPSPEGRYLVYTAPPGVGGARWPHLVAVRLADSATRALTLGEAPEGFARFLPEGAPAGMQSLVYVRFPDDDDANGVLDAKDSASLWRLDLDLDRMFGKSGAQATSSPARAALPEPFPLSDGAIDDLFPDVSGPYVYFTQGDRQQDILRLPVTGMFPDYAREQDGGAAKYFALAKTIDEPRTRWFALRAVLARSEKGALLRAQALLEIATLQLGRERPDLARRALEQLAAEVTETKEGQAAELGGLARVELVSIDRRRGLADAPRPIDKERVLRRTQAELDRLAGEYAWSPVVVARVDLEEAEVLVDRGDRARAIDAFENVVRAHGEQPVSAARAMLRQIELLGVAHDPDALGEAYSHVLERFPGQRDAVRAASERIVKVQLEGLAANASWRTQVDALSRLLPRFDRDGRVSPVRLAARRMIVRLLREHGALEGAALQLERLVDESGADRLGAVKALAELALVYEELGRLDTAIESWQRIRSSFRDLPGYDADARDAITRVGLAKAAREEARGNREAARAVYASIIENDLTQVKAHRRYLALSAETGKLDEAIRVAKERAERSSRTPMARYAYGLALTWLEPPRLDDALKEIEAALELNPQFTHAYITRGWILEMKELEKPGFFGEVWATLRRSANTAIGGIFNVDISEPDYLLQAIDDYTRALQLNRESEDADTEAEILLDDGNASYRLGDKTNDLGNMRKAFSRYVDVLKYGYRFQSPLTELVFWERLGRAATWSEEWAVSTMATRRAITLAKKLGQEARLSQLYGNLSLAYDQAGEGAYANQALASSQSALEVRKVEGKLLVSKRNRAVSKLDQPSLSPELVDGALTDLDDARVLLERAKLPPRSVMWVGAVEDASSAQYGFGRTAELNVNTALAERAHRELGDLSRARALRERRRFLAAEVMDGISKFLGVMPEEPTTLLMIRDRLGLVGASARAAAERGDLGRALQLLDDAGKELDGWIANPNLVRDKPSLLVDRARIAALATELYAASDAIDEGRAKTMANVLERSLGDLDRALLPPDVKTSTAPAPKDTDEQVAAIPAALSSTTALAATATVALSAPRLEGTPLEVRAVHARVLYAQGLLALKDLERSATPKDLAGLLADLDREVKARLAARTAFEDAARHAATAGPALGARLLVLSLDASAWLSSQLADRPAKLVADTRAQAVDLARVLGREELALRIEFDTLMGRGAGDLAKAEALVKRALPQDLGTSLPLVERVLVRSASVAAAKKDLASALASYDRLMLLQTATRPYGGGLGLSDADDKAFAQSYRDRWAELRDATNLLASSDGGTARETWEERRRNVTRVRRALESMRSASIGDAAKARAFAEPVLEDGVLDALGPADALLAIVPAGDAVELLWVDGSTAAPSRYTLVSAPVPARDLARAVESVGSALAKGARPDGAAVEQLRAALVRPLEARLQAKKRVIFADLLAGGPIPETVLWASGPAVVHVSSPTAFALAKGEQLVGVDGSVAIALAGAPHLAETKERLDPAAALAFRRTVRPSESELVQKAKDSGQARRLADREPVEVLADRATKLVVIEAPVRVEPDVPERSVIDLRATAATPLPPEVASDDGAWNEALAGEASRFREELPLEALALPAQHLVLARVSGAPAGLLRERVRPGDLLRLDLVLASRGFASTVLVPDAVPAEAAKRVIAAYVAAADEKGPALALAEAVRAEVATTPAAALIALVGSPGLDREAMRRFAKDAAPKALSRAMNQYKNNQFVAAVPSFERLIRLLRETGDEKQVAAYTLLARIFSDSLPVPVPSRAADAWNALLGFLASRPKSEANDKAIANARVDLGRALGLAGDFEAAEASFQQGIDELGKLGARLDVARGYFLLGQHYEQNRLDFKTAASLLERSIGLYEGAKAFEKKPPEEAGRAVRNAGALYLNRLSDAAAAKAAFERAYKYAQSDAERVNATISLARVARRRGDFQEAAERAEASRGLASKLKRPDLEADAIVEAANVAWYQGDYRRGQDLCTESLDKVQSLEPGQRKRRKIYALSVCGLIAMSRREFSLARDTLERARKLAENARDTSEVSAQYNNLGRVFLEFGRADEAIDAFRRALAIDTALNDRFALAYDLRNLGTALAYQREDAEAEQTLVRGLQYSLDVKDSNNELRARFALAELARERGDLAAATKLYREALPLAESLDVRDLAWQIHRALGLLASAAKAPKEAEAELRKAVQIVRSITGRSAASDFGPQRYAAYDDLVGLLLETDRAKEAFLVADTARSLEQVELLDDSRIRLASKDVPELLRQVREARTATAAAGPLEKLAASEPHLAELLSPADVDQLRAGLPEDAAVVVYRVADEEIVSFVLDRAGLTARRTAVSARALRDEVREYGRRLAARADLSSSNRALAERLIDPIRDLVATKKRVAIVPHRWLRYVAFPALPFSADGRELLADRFVLVQALDPRGAARALAAPLGPIAELPIVALGAPEGGPLAVEGPLPFAKKELEEIREEYPRAELVLGRELTRSALAQRIAGSAGVVHFAGHSRLVSAEDAAAGFVDPLGGQLVTADGGLPLLEVLGLDTRARLVVLSACSSLLGASETGAEPAASGDELLSLAEAFQIAGADNVLATTMRVDDVAAAMVMKRFYRAARRLDAASALREAQLAVRKLYPHPAWWASFVLLSR